MNKKILFLILILGILILPVFAQAVEVKTIINNIKTSLSGIAGALATIAFIIAGIMFLSATGNPSRMTIAKGALIAGVIGIVIMILAGEACNFVNMFFGNIGTCT